MSKDTLINDGTRFVPTIPDMKYMTIGDVSKLIDVPTHSIRYWEKEDESLPGANIIKTERKNNRRVYTKSTILTLFQLRTLIIDEEHTVPGALNKLKVKKESQVIKKPIDSRYAALLTTLESRLVEMSELLSA